MIRARLALALTLAAGCLRPAEDRALADLEAGLAEAGGVAFQVQDHLAAVLDARAGSLTLWAQAPTLRIHADSAGDATVAWTLTVRNCLADADLVAQDAATGAPLPVTALQGSRATEGRWQLVMPAGRTALLELAPPDANDPSPYRIAFLADIQEAVDRVEDIYERMNEDPSLRFVVFGGDLTDRGTPGEMDANLAKLEQLGVPMYMTIGNHELFDDDRYWERRFGPRSFHFAFRGVHVTLLDSSSATIDPRVYDRLDSWLDDAATAVHVVATHYPPFDPVGVREGGFRSRDEAAKLMSKLARGRVDELLTGHIHSYYADEWAGVPMFISGGGGAPPQERLDGIGRHYLTLDLEPGDRVAQTALVRVE